MLFQRICLASWAKRTLLAITNLGFLVSWNMCWCAEPLVATLHGGDRINSLIVTSDSKTLIGIRSGEAKVNLWELADLKSMQVVELPSPPRGEIAVSPLGDYIFVVTRGDRDLRLEAGTGRMSSLVAITRSDLQIEAEVALPLSEPWGVSVSPQGERIAICGNRQVGNGDLGVIATVRTSDWRTLGVHIRPHGPIGSVAFIPDGTGMEVQRTSLLFSWIGTKNDRHISELNLETGNHFERCMGLRFRATPDGKWVAVLGPHEVSIFNRNTRITRQLERAIGDEPPASPTEKDVSAAEFIPGTSFVVIGYTYGKLALWDLSTFTRKTLVSTKHVKHIHALAASPDGKTIAIGGGIYNGDIEVWTIEQLIKE